MHFLEYFYTKSLKYDLINKFFYKNINELPKLKKIILNFGCKTTEIKQLAASSLALELITKQKGILTTTKHSNIFLKIRKGNPIGCKISLQKASMFNFLEKTLIKTFPKTKNFNGLTFTKKTKKNAYSYQIQDNFSFSELEKHYYLFYNLSKLDITIVTNTKVKEETIFLLKSLQLPLKKKND